MANLIPFHGVLYDPEAVGDIREVVAPPYDVIDAEYQRALHSRHPQNVIRLELGLDQPDDGPSQNRYSRAAGFLQEWLASGKLRRDPHPAIYLYTIEYHVPSGRSGTATRVLKGFLSAVELEEFGTCLGVAERFYYPGIRQLVTYQSLIITELSQNAY